MQVGERLRILPGDETAVVKCMSHPYSDVTFVLRMAQLSMLKKSQCPGLRLVQMQQHTSPSLTPFTSELAAYCAHLRT
jgi:hypothetical protein